MKTITINRVRGYSREQDYDAFTVVRLCNSQLKDLGGRHAWVKITAGSKSIYRRVRGAANTGLSSGDMELDYDSRLELDIDGSKDENGFRVCNVSIAPAGFLGSLIAHWGNPNIEYQVSFRLAVLGVALGLLGGVLGAISLYK